MSDYRWTVTRYFAAPDAGPEERAGCARLTDEYDSFAAAFAAIGSSIVLYGGDVVVTLRGELTAGGARDDDYVVQ